MPVRLEPAFRNLLIYSEEVDSPVEFYRFDLTLPISQLYYYRPPLINFPFPH